jgi:hypothetical protein
MIEGKGDRKRMNAKSKAIQFSRPLRPIGSPVCAPTNYTPTTTCDESQIDPGEEPPRLSFPFRSDFHLPIFPTLIVKIESKYFDLTKFLPMTELSLSSLRINLLLKNPIFQGISHESIRFNVAAFCLAGTVCSLG